VVTARSARRTRCGLFGPLSNDVRIASVVSARFVDHVGSAPNGHCQLVLVVLWVVGDGFNEGTCRSGGVRICVGVHPAGKYFKPSPVEGETWHATRCTVLTKRRGSVSSDTGPEGHRRVRTARVAEFWLVVFSRRARPSARGSDIAAPVRPRFVGQSRTTSLRSDLLPPRLIKGALVGRADDELTASGGQSPIVDLLRVCCRGWVPRRWRLRHAIRLILCCGGRLCVEAGRSLWVGNYLAIWEVVVVGNASAGKRRCAG
jgi:hypothetical protein